MFHVRLLDMVRPSSLALDTHSSSLLSTTIGANRGSSFTKDILSSLHLSLSSWTLLCVNYSVTLCTISRAQPRLPLAMTVDAVVLSTYFNTLAKLSTSKSFISTRNSQSSDILTLWERLERESMIQLIILVGRFKLHNFSTSILWSIGSNTFLKSKKIALTVAPFPSVSFDKSWSMCISAWVVEELRTAPYWFGTSTSRTARFM